MSLLGDASSGRHVDFSSLGPSRGPTMCWLWLLVNARERDGTQAPQSWADTCFSEKTKAAPIIHMAFLSLLNSHAWTSSPEPPTASTEFTGKFGDVLLAAMLDHLIFRYLARQWHQPGDNRLCILQSATSTNGDYLTSWPPAFLLSTSSHSMTWSVHKPSPVLSCDLFSEKTKRLHFRRPTWL